MRRFLSSLLVITLHLVSSNSSAQQYDSFRQVGEASGFAAGTVTSISLDPNGSLIDSQISYLNAAGLSTVYNLNLTASSIVRDSMPVYMPSDAFRSSEESMTLDDVGFYIGQLVDPQNPDSSTPSHWFRLTHYNGVWSGAFRIADRIYSIDRRYRDNIVEVRSTPSQNRFLQPSRQVKVTAVIDEEFVFADSPGDSIGMDSLGHIYALESLHVMEGVMNDSLGITVTVDQLVYQQSGNLVSTAQWIENNAVSFGMDDNYASFIFSGADAVAPVTGGNYTVVNKSDFLQLRSANKFGELLGIREESGTLQSNQDPLDAAHWSEEQKADLLATLPITRLMQMISSDEPEIEITEPEEVSIPIPQDILDSELVESDPQASAGTENPSTTGNNGLFLDDEQVDATTDGDVPAGGGGTLSPILVLGLLFSAMVFHRRSNRFS